MSWTNEAGGKRKRPGKGSRWSREGLVTVHMLGPWSKSKLSIGPDPSDRQKGHGDALPRPLERGAGWGPFMLLPLLLGPCSPWVHPGNTGGCGALRQHGSCVPEPEPSDTRMGPLCSPPQYCCSSEGPAKASPRGNSEFSLTLEDSHLAPPWPCAVGILYGAQERRTEGDAEDSHAPTLLPEPLIGRREG